MEMRFPPMTPEQQAAAAGHLGFALRVVRHVCRSRPWLRDEAESAALVTLAEAVLSYDPARASLATHIDRRLRWMIVDLETDAARRQRAVEDAAQRASVSSRCPAGMAAHRDEIGRVRVVMRQMPAREAEALRIRFGLDRDRPGELREVAYRFGVGIGQARQIERAALRRLQRAMEGGDRRGDAR
jgi:DNA-directed RNA polymerase specialized sigma subunit